MRAVQQAPLLLFAVSGSLLLGALGFQHLANLAPCEMCYWQRYAHLSVLVLAAIAYLSKSRAVTLIAIAAMLVSAGLGLFHAGVEQQWWEGPACSSSLKPGMSQADILGSLMNAPLIRCDAIAWQLFGLSMAGWNAVISLLASIGAWLLWRRT